MTRTLLVAYDLNRPEADYPGLIDAIKKQGAWWHHLDSLWLVNTNLSPGEMRDVLKPFVDTNDELLVIDVTGRARSWRGFSERGGKWLRETFLRSS